MGLRMPNQPGGIHITDAHGHGTSCCGVQSLLRLNGKAVAGVAIRIISGELAHPGTRPNQVVLEGRHSFHGVNPRCCLMTKLIKRNHGTILVLCKVTQPLLVNTHSQALAEDIGGVLGRKHKGVFLFHPCQPTTRTTLSGSTQRAICTR